MPSQDADPEQVNATLAPFYYGAKDNWKDETKKPLDAQRPYIEKTLGFADLRKMIEWGKQNGYGGPANVVFWGDSGDGMLQMEEESVRLVHRLLVEEMGQHGHFFDFAVLSASAEDVKTRSKYVLLDHGGGRGVETNAPVYADWAGWRSPATRY